jgi:glycosyltransferase involved in cell wall biosynthesis
MPNGLAKPELFLNMLVARQLDRMTTGNGAYLMVLLRAVRRAGLKVRLVHAPRRSFGNRPWFTIHPDFAAIAAKIVVPQSVRLGGRYWSLSPVVWGRFAARLGQEALRRAGLKLGAVTRVTSLLGDPLSQTEAAQLAHISDRMPTSIVVAEYSALGPVLALLKSPVHKAVLLHDMFSLRAAAFRARGDRPDFRDTSEAEEVANISHAETLIFGSANELAHFRSLTPRAIHVWLRPEVPDYAAANDDAPPRAVFLGTRHAGNADALKHLIDDIWPLVRRKAPDASLWVAGSVCEDLSPTQASAPGVRIMGRVEHLISIGGGASIGLAPTRLASGVSIKVAEYLRLGMPCIAYPVALEGFGRELDDLVDVADGPQAMADRILVLLNDGAARRQRSEQGRAAAAKRLDNQEVVDVLRAASGG